MSLRFRRIWRAQKSEPSQICEVVPSSAAASRLTAVL
jgi:hypothetical protein